MARLKHFVFESITGGGLLSQAGDPPASLLAEGRAMVTALAADLAALENGEVLLLRDARLPPLGVERCDQQTVGNGAELESLFRRHAATADWTWIIAPELEDELGRWADLARRCGGRPMLSAAESLHLASRKHETAQRLHLANVPAPRGILLTRHCRVPEDFGFPAVLKPNLGAGSQDVRLIRNRRDLSRLDRSSAEMRLEQWRPGEAVSVALLCGPGVHLALPTVRQLLAEPTFSYRGGSLPLPTNRAQRASRLARRAAACLGELLGFVGFDMVLGPAADGSQDVVIEVNPRLTTSYVGLRAACQDNLAAAMLRIAAGEAVAPEFPARRLTFSPDGRVSWD